LRAETSGVSPGRERRQPPVSTPFRYLVLDGETVPYEEAKLHIQTPAVRYGATAFEGIIGHWNAEEQQLYLFRCLDHLARLLQSARLMGMSDPGYTVDELATVVLELLQANDVRQDVHIRPSLFVSGGGSIQARGPVSLGVGLAPAGAVIGSGRWAEKPFRLAVSSWRRVGDAAMPPRIKASANYQNARLALLQAEEDGYDGAVLLDDRGHVTEEARACVFIVRRGTAVTPPVTSDILESITRETAIQLLREVHGREVCEREVDRTELYVADEVFLTGTAMGVTPVGVVDRFDIGDTTPGPVTWALGETYSALADGRSDLYPEWRMPVYR